MNIQHVQDELPASEAETQSLAELFHLVKSLIPDGQELVVASPEMTVAEAIQLMRRYDFSQLPVVAGQTVLGVFSFRSLTTKLLEMGQATAHFGDLPVDEFIEHFNFVQPSDNWESTLDYLDRDNGVLVGYRDQLEGILTPMDVLNYLCSIASQFVMLAGIELSLRRIIQACVSNDELKACIQNSLTHKYSPSETPARLWEMTFSDYVQIIGDGRNWPQFSIVFGKGEWQRKITAEKLRAVRDLRNDVFHLKRKLTPEDYKRLTAHREWLQMKIRAFEARKPGKAVAVKRKQKIEKRKWDEPSFFQKLESGRGADEADIARKILEWARSRMTRVWWGRGSRSGSFVPVLNHKGRDHQLFAVWTYGTVEIYFYWYQYKSPFDSEGKRQQLLGRLNAIEGISLPDEAIVKRPGIPLSVLQNEAALKQFLEVFDWIVREIQST